MKTFLISCETKNVNYYFPFLKIFIKITWKMASMFQVVYDLHPTFLSSQSPRPGHHRCLEGITHCRACVTIESTTSTPDAF